jgi:hypothetical protein
MNGNNEKQLSKIKTLELADFSTLNKDLDFYSDIT